jgi:hypothetical protein
MPANGPAIDFVFITYNYPYEAPKPCQNANVRSFFPTRIIERSDLNKMRYNALLVFHLLPYWHLFRCINQALNPDEKEESGMSYRLIPAKIPCFWIVL